MNEVLERRGDERTTRLGPTLYAKDHLPCVERRKERILSRRFGNAAPARVTGDVQHRGERPVAADDR